MSRSGVRVWLVAAAVGLGLAAALVLGSRWSALLVVAVAAVMATLTWQVRARLGPAQRAMRIVVLVLLLGWAAGIAVAG